MYISRDADPRDMPRRPTRHTLLTVSACGRPVGGVRLQQSDGEHQLSADHHVRYWSVPPVSQFSTPRLIVTLVKDRLVTLLVHYTTVVFIILSCAYYIFIFIIIFLPCCC